MQTRLGPAVQMPLNASDAVALFPSLFFLCAACVKWMQTALGKGEVCARVRGSCVGWRFR